MRKIQCFQEVAKLRRDRRGKVHGCPRGCVGAVPAAHQDSTEPQAQEWHHSRLACAHVQPHQPTPASGTGFPKACAENAPGTCVPLAAGT